MSISPSISTTVTSLPNQSSSYLQCGTRLAARQGEVLLQGDHREGAALFLDQLHLQERQALVRGLVAEDHIRVRLLGVHVRGEVGQALLDVLPHLLLVDRVQALEDHDLVGLDELRRVLVACVVVVD